jgi:SprT protein
MLPTSSKNPALLTDQQISEVIEQTALWIERAVNLYQFKQSKELLKQIEIRFDLKGRTSGMFCVNGRHWWIRYNPWIFTSHYQESISQTIPHEVAHYICYLLYGSKPRPHGREWQKIMQDFGVPAQATCKLNLESVPQKRLKRYRYQCRCQIHELTSIRHNRIVRGHQQYVCTKCKQPLTAI